MTHVSHDYEVGTSIGLALHIFVKISKYEYYSMRSSTYARDGSVSFISFVFIYARDAFLTGMPA
jgi:hypothetical protein